MHTSTMILAAVLAFGANIPGPTQRPVAVDLGPKAYRDGDVVQITHVTSTSPRLEHGDTVTVKGRVHLKSHSEARLGLYLTQTQGDGKATAEASQTRTVKKGVSEFKLTTTIKHKGFLHLTFYGTDDGKPFGGVYFGTRGQMQSISDWDLSYYFDD